MAENSAFLSPARVEQTRWAASPMFYATAMRLTPVSGLFTAIAADSLVCWWERGTEAKDTIRNLRGRTDFEW